ncbi:unnamed protein product [Rhodiola kirilowii]
MGRGRVQLKMIENKINRQVTFSKRRTGLLKKAHEISVMCDAELALIVFSNKGKLFEYSTDSCMEKILEKYERYSYAERKLAGIEQPNPSSQENWSLEYSKMNSKLELLQRNQRHYLGEDLGSLSLRELQNLEQSIDMGLKNIRSRKNQLMHESISELQKKEKAMQEQNKLLAKKFKENEKTMRQQQAQWSHQQNHGHDDLGNSHRHGFSSSFLIPQTLPCLNMHGSFAYQQGEMEHAVRPNDHNNNNDLDLTLEPIFSCSNLGCFAG